MRRWWKIGLFLGGPVFLLVWFLAWSRGGFLGGTEFCTTCGCQKATTRLFWIPFAELKETELSQFYDGYKEGEAHEHRWLFAGGGGGSIRCTIGEGRYLYPAVIGEETRLAMEQIAMNRSEREVDVWLGRLLDPDASRDAYAVLFALAEEDVFFEAVYAEVEESWKNTQWFWEEGGDATP